MTKYRIKLCSKDKKSLHHFLSFLKHNIKTQNFQLSFNSLRKKKVVKKVTVLKSPHVNKTAQEHFGYTLYSIELLCYSWEIKKYLIILKKIRNQLFPGIKIQISGKFSGAKKPFKELLLNPTNVLFYGSSWVPSKQKMKSESLSSNTDLKNKNLLEKNLLYLNVLNCYGEL
jgi:ribosomal protein S10